jgi:clan AA aspartic protease
VAVELGVITPDKVRKLKISGLVDTGASRLVLPKAIAEELGLPEEGKLYVRYADGRRAKRTVVQDAQVTMLGRTGVFSAIVEPRQKDALIGAIVLEELDLIPDCSAQKLLPRDPAGVLAEIE